MSDTHFLSGAAHYYDTYETSVENSRPIELFTLVLGATTWRYTNSPDDITIGANTWTATPISRSEINDKREELEQTVSVELPTSLPLPQLYITSVPGITATLEVQRTQDLDTVPGPREIITIFKGRIESVSFTKDGAVATLLVRAFTAAFSKELPRQRYSNVCNHALYDSRCGVVKATYAHSGTVDAISGRTIDVNGASGEADGYYRGGYVETSGGLDRRLILEHVGDTLTLPLAFADVVVTDTVTIYPGCGHSVTDCRQKFSNILNFGGFPYVPTKNPFETGLY